MSCDVETSLLITTVGVEGLTTGAGVAPGADGAVGSGVVENIAVAGGGVLGGVIVVGGEELTTTGSVDAGVTIGEDVGEERGDEGGTGFCEIAD